MLCVIAKIDEAATAALQKLQMAAVRYGAPLKRLHGHITLVSYIGEDETGFITHCRNVLRDAKPLSVEYIGLSVLTTTNIIVAAPRKTDALQQLHHRLGDGHWESLDQWSQEAVWEPHTTLVYHPKLDLWQICRRMQAQFNPLTARVTRIEFSKVTTDGYEILGAVELK